MSHELEYYYNAQRLQSICLTFDTDWAPDFVLDDLCLELEKAQAKSTFFATNPTASLVESESLEVAIHPNFMPGSSHGETTDEVLTQLKEWFPNAIGMRSHGLWQSTNMLQSLSRYGIKYDCNLLMHDLPHLQAFHTFYDVLRIPYLWADASHWLAGRPMKLEAMKLNFPGMKVIDIHPMHWYLNSSNSRAYNALKEKHRSLQSLTKSQADEFVNHDVGVRTLLDDLLNLCRANKVSTYLLRDFHAEFMNSTSAARHN